MFIIGTLAALAQAGAGLVISQMYPGGGNSGATYNGKFLEIYNPTSSAISTSGVSIQYASAGGTSYATLPLTAAMIQPGHYFLVQTTLGTTGANLTTAPNAVGGPDQTGTISTSGTAGKIFLVNTTTALTDTTCAAILADGKIIDFVGYGATASCYEGASVAPQPTSNAYSLNRTNPTSKSTNNGQDFVQLTPPNPHNSTYSTSGTVTLSGSGSANPSSVIAGNSTTLTVTVTPGSTSTGITVTADLSLIGGSSTTSLPSTGTTNTYSTSTTVTTSSTGTINLPVTVMDQQGGVASFNIPLAVSQPAPFVAIDVIQGVKSTTAQSLSPYAGQRVATSGVVTTILSNAFFIQTPDAQADTNPLTPEGIEVYTSTKPTVSIGNIVSVTGTVQTYPAVTASKTPASEITSPTVTVTDSTNTVLPAPITLTKDMTAPDSLWQFTPYEGMRVSIPSMTAISGTDGSLTESTETTVTNGYFYGVIGDTPRPFREPGIDIRDPFAPLPANVAHFDDNPERIIVTTTLSGGSSIELSTGTVLPNVTGVLDFTYSSDSYFDPSRLILDASYDRTQVTPNLVPQPVMAKASNEFVVASFNIERFFNTLSSDDKYAVPQGVSCFSGDASKGTNLCASEAVDVIQTAYNGRLKKLGLAIENVLLLPDVVTLEEVENQSVANDIAAQINSDTGIPGLYTALSTDNQTYFSNDGTGISVGFLVKNTVDNLGFTQIGQASTFTPSTGSLTTLNDRPWLVLNAGIKRAAGTKDYPVTVIVNHMKSLINVNSTTSNSTRLKKELQSEAIASYINTAQANGQHVISGGDFNAFEFSDGYTDTLATYTNTNVLPSDQVVQPGVAGIVTPSLIDLPLTLPAAQRWSYQEDGSAQILDHMVITQDLQATGVRFAYAHLNADFPISAYSNTTTPARVSDHDAAVGYFILPAPVLSATLTPPSTDFGSIVVGAPSPGQQFTLTNTGEAPITVSSLSGSGDFAASSSCSTVAINATCVINIVFTPTASGSRTGTLTVVTNTSTGTYTSSLTGTGAAAKMITFAQPATPAPAGTTATLSATASNGDPVTFSVTAGTGTASISGNVITYLTPGTVTVNADSAATSTYAAAPTVSYNVTINAIPFVFVAGNGSVASLNSYGVSSSATANGGTGAAVDQNGYVWSINSNGTSVSTFTPAGALGTSYSPTGVTAASALAIDGNSNVIITSGNGTISVVSNAGTTAYTASGSTIAAPSGIAIDISGDIWVANPAGTLDEIIGGAAPVLPLSTAVTADAPGTRP
jgi:predicted extracellular nuclease